MNDQERPEPISLLLSRDELLVILKTLETAQLPGLDDEPNGPRTEAEQLLALEVAIRGLRARGLALMQNDGTFLLHDTLLNLVGTCAYPQSTLFIFHWPAGQEEPVRYFGHLRADQFVVHTRPDPVLHLFSLLGTREQLLENALDFCHDEETTSPLAFEFSLSSNDFGHVRELSEQGNVQEAFVYLAERNIQAEAATSFIHTLSSNPRVSILQTLQQTVNNTVIKRDFTLIQDTQATWFVGAVDATDENTLLRIQIMNRSELIALLDQWVC